MSHGHPHASPPPEPSIRLSEGWHCSHLYYHFDRAELARMESKVRQQGCEAVVAALDQVVHRNFVSEFDASTASCRAAGTQSVQRGQDFAFLLCGS